MVLKCVRVCVYLRTSRGSELQAVKPCTDTAQHVLLAWSLYVRQYMTDCITSGIWYRIVSSRCCRRRRWWWKQCGSIRSASETVMSSHKLPLMSSALSSASQQQQQQQQPPCLSTDAVELRRIYSLTPGINTTTSHTRTHTHTRLTAICPGLPR